MACRTASIHILAPLAAGILVLGNTPASATDRFPAKTHEPVSFVLAFQNRGETLQVRSIASGPNGFLWLAAANGLYRFDGLHFHSIDSQPVEHVATTADGFVWTGSSQAGLSAFDPKRNVWYRGVVNEPVRSLVARRNEVVAATARSLWAGRLDSLKDLHTPANGILTLDGKQRVWFASGAGICVLNLDGSVQPAANAPSGKWVAAVEDDDGRLWAWRPGEIAMSSSTSRQRGVYGDDSADLNQPTGLLAFRDGHSRIWVSPNDWIEGGALWRGVGLARNLFDPSIAQDENGNLWISADRAALSMKANRTFIERDRDVEESHRVFRLREPGLAIQARSSGLRSFEGQWRTWGRTDFGGRRIVDALDTTDGIWIIVEDRGIYLLDRSGNRIATAYEGSFRGIDFRTLFADRTGRIWVGAKTALYVLDPHSHRLTQFSALQKNTVSALAFASGLDGQEWLGSSAGISRLEEGTWKIVVPAASILYESRIRTLAVGPGPTFWISYRRDGAFSRISPAAIGTGWKRTDFFAEAGFGPPGTHRLLRDHRGWIWRATEAGLFVCDERNSGAPEDWARIGESQGLASDWVNDVAEDERSGEMWLSTKRGLATVRPQSSWFEPIHSSPPRVTAIHVNGLLDARANREIPARVERFQIDFAQWPGNNPRRPAVHFRLQPSETEWRTDAGGSATYRNLPLGNYRFEMRGDRDEQVHSFAFRIGPSAQALWGGSIIAVLSCAIAVGWWELRRRRQSTAIADYWKAKSEFLASSSPGLASTGAETGQLIAGRYRIEASIGEGGFSEVFRATDIQNGGSVALKILRRAGEIPGWQAERFQRETEALHQIQDAGIVRLLDHGQDTDGTLYLVMPLIQGESLRSILKRGIPDRSRAVRWISELGTAIAIAHRSGVLHRDLKPDNILIDGITDSVVIVDFGAATTAGNGNSAIMLGSLDYWPRNKSRAGQVRLRMSTRSPQLLSNW